MESNLDVLIVGAGPTGLLLACDLARRGLACRLIDRAGEPSKLSRAVAVQARSLEILEDLGLLERALDEGTELPASNNYRDGELVQRTEFALEPSAAIPHPKILIVEQHLVEEMLTELLLELGGSLEREVEFKELEQDDAGVTVTLSSAAGTERIRCKYLVGCDGPRSPVRKALNIAFRGDTYPNIYALAEVDVDWELPRECHRFERNQKSLMAFPIGTKKRYRLTFWEPAGNKSEEGPDIWHGFQEQPPTLELFEEAARHLVPIATTLSQPTSLMRYRVGRRVAARYSKKRVFLAGDAAHVHPPTGFHGMNFGLQDAYNLGWKLEFLARGKGLPALARSYEVERRPAAQAGYDDTEHSARLYARFGPLEELPIPDVAARITMTLWDQLEANYKDSPIVAQLEQRSDGLACEAGNRAPDGRLREPSTNRSLRLFELFRGTRHHLLVFACRGEQIDPLLKAAEQALERHPEWLRAHTLAVEGAALDHWAGQLLTDPGGQAHSDYWVQTPTLILVRPDGHVAFRAGAEHVEKIAPYLADGFVLSA